MATRTRDIFTTIHTEGAILPPDLLQRIAEGGDGLDGLRAEDYHRPGEKLNEVINRAWNVLLGAWANFQTAQEHLPADDIGTTITRERWLLPLFRELDYGRLPTERAVEFDGKSYPISHRDAEGNVPIHLVSYKVDLDRRTPGVAGAATTSPHSMLQVFLNRSDDVLWGFLSNGLRLRILRDNVSLTRQAYVEFDLEAMMTGEVYADFVLLWLVCHSSRVEGERPEQFWLERWMQTAIEQGTRALDQLRDNVQVAIECLGAGFLAHPHNMHLRDKLQDGRLDQQDYYRQLLRLVYRLLFLFVAEDRGLLLDPAADDIARARYTEYYSTRRLRDLAEHFTGTRHHDLFHGLRLVMQLLGAERNGEGRALGLPVLGSYLFSDAAVMDLIDCEIGNRDLLDAIRALAFTEDRAVRRLRPIDYKNLGPEELGSVYESLLELHPQINVPVRTFALSTASGHERKTTGSYYTPTSLIQALLDSALDPVLDEARTHGEAAILDLKICDPACGSGHFLIAASHRIAKALAAVRTHEDEPAPAAVRSALRDVIGHCIYGVDINPMAVELCKVGLWMEALEPGKPLSFLDHRIQCGNSLLGTTPALMARGIPDDAFPTKSGLIEGDENKVVSKLRSRNRDERKARESGQRSMFEIIEPPADYAVLAAEVDALDALDDATLAGVRAKEDRYRALADDPDYIAARLLADAWCAAFVWRKAEAATFGDDDRPVPPPITDLTYRLMEENPHDDRWRDLRPYVAYLRERYQFFHWHVAFPDVFHVSQSPPRHEGEGDLGGEGLTGWDGGFDVVLGNPPWERIKIQEKEWFAERSPEIAGAPNAAARRKLIRGLKDTDPVLLAAFQEDKRKAEGESHFVRASQRYPLTAVGDVNTYALFAGLSRTIRCHSGRAGTIIPTGIATDKAYSEFFKRVVDDNDLVCLLGFVNSRKIFRDIKDYIKYAIVVFGKAPFAEFMYLLTEVGQLSEDERKFTLTAREFSLLSPNSGNCPIFRFKRDAEITKSVYRLLPVLILHEPSTNPWRISFLAMFHMSNDSHLFRTASELGALGYELKGNLYINEVETYVPLYEAKMIALYDHRSSNVIVDTEVMIRQGKPEDLSEQEHLSPNTQPMPRYWVNAKDVNKTIPDEYDANWFQGFANVTSSTNHRTMITTIIPRVAVGNSMPLILFPQSTHSRLKSCFFASFATYIFDYIGRQKLGGPNYNFFVVEQLPVLPRETYIPALLDFITPRVLELTYTAWDLLPFAQDVGWDGPPFIWDEERRFLMRCELDALYFHLYGIARDDVDYIMETFPIVKRKDEAATATDDSEGEYVTKRVILEMYDQMAALGVFDDADRITDFKTWLSPPPASPEVAHPLRED
jgi:hypothetical protein